MRARTFLGRVGAILERHVEGQTTAKPVEQLLPPRELMAEVDVDFAHGGKDEGELLNMVEQYVRHSVRTASPKFFNQLFAGAQAPAIAGEWVAAATNTSAYTYEMAPMATVLERELIRHMGRKVGFDTPGGAFVTGGSNANMLAILCALHRAFPEAKTEGVGGLPPVRMYVSEAAHYSFTKALLTLGLGTNSLVAIPTDETGAMKPEVLKERLKQDVEMGRRPLAIVATAGTTVQGAYDPIEPLAELAQRYGAWMHVDGSWGGSAILSSTHKYLLKGSKRADSFTWNPHKMMNVPLVCSAFLVADPRSYASAVSAGDTSYIFHDENDESSYDLGRSSLQCGKRVDSLKLYLAWQANGDEGYEKRIDRIFLLARYAKEIVGRHLQLELLSPVVSANVCFRVHPGAQVDDMNEFTMALREHLKRTGQIYVNQAFVGDERALRLITANPEVDESDIDAFFEIVLREAEVVAETLR